MRARARVFGVGFRFFVFVIFLGVFCSHSSAENQQGKAGKKKEGKTAESEAEQGTEA